MAGSIPAVFPESSNFFCSASISSRALVARFLTPSQYSLSLVEDILSFPSISAFLKVSSASFLFAVPRVKKASAVFFAASASLSKALACASIPLAISSLACLAVFTFPYRVSCM